MNTNTATVEVSLPPSPAFKVIRGGAPFSKKVLEHLYVKEGMGLKRVAETLGVGPQRVRRELVAYGVPIRPPTYSAQKLSVEQLEAAKLEILAEKARLREEIQNATKAEKAALRREISDLEEIWADTDRAYVEAMKERDEARAQVQAQETLVGQLQAALANRKPQTASMEVQDLLREVIAGPQNPEQCLRLVAAAYPDRVILLPSALRSAKDVQNFQRVRGLAGLLQKWVTMYHDALVSGGGDEQGHDLLGWSFAAKNGDGAQKSFEYKGRKVNMPRHLRIGTKESFNETIRVFFAWDSAERKLVIGWCGKHP
jgi:hypothetical protein